MVGPSFSSATNFMLRNLSRMPTRELQIITKSPPKQYSTSKVKVKENREEMKPLYDNENAVIVFDDIVGSSKTKYIDQFFIRGRHNSLDIS